MRLLQQSHVDALASLPKGDPVSVAEIAGIMAAKRCSELIPLCHPIPLSSITVEITVEDGGMRIVATIRIPPSSTVISTVIELKGIGWQSGMSSEHRFAAMMPAISATETGSPFGKEARAST